MTTLGLHVDEPFNRVRHDHDAVVAGAIDWLTRRRHQAEALLAQIGGSGG